jgi:hypothetical protein
MSEYIFERNPVEEEFRRLRLVEDALDPATISHLERIGIREGWRCLELGPGAGSIMKWLACAVGMRGAVVGVDKNVDYLQGLSSPPCQILAADFLEASLDREFDLAHCRYVLIHNRCGDDMLRKLGEFLKAGGVLIVEEPDFTSARLLNKNCDPAQQCVNNAMCRMFEELLLDPAYGLSLPRKIAEAGLHIVHAECRVHLARGGSPVARMMAASTTSLANTYVATGEAIRSDIERYVRNAADKKWWSIYYSTVSVVATKSR